jgi:hypothetical protein
LLVLSLLCAGRFTSAQSDAFTYQGRLTANGEPVNGSHDLRLSIHDAAEDGNVVAGPLELNAVAIVNGLFTVRPDLGPDVFAGPSRWLQIEVRATGSPEYTTLSPRQEITSTPYAIRAQTAAKVADGSVAAEQLSIAGAPPTAGQFLSYDGGGFNWSDPGETGAGIFSLNGTTAYYNGGSVGLGTNSPAPGIQLQVNGTTRFTPGGSAGVIQFGTPAGETGMAIIGNNRADIRFDDFTLKLAVGSGNGAPAAANGLAITFNGNVGIGTVIPYERFSVGGGTKADTKIEIDAGGDDYAGLRFYNSAGSWVWQVTPSNDAPGGRLRLTDELSGSERISITREGNVGIGTATPAAKLHVTTPEPGKAAVYGVVGSTASVGVYGEANSTSSAGVWGRNPAGVAVYADGNAGQARDKGGFVKAMAFINPFLPADQYVVRCYNAQQAGNAASTAPCGIAVTRQSIGSYWIDFGFKVDDRFISVTPTQNGVTTSAVSVSPNVIAVGFSRSEDPVERGERAFYILVY